MDANEIVKTILGYIGDDTEKDWILAHAVEIILDSAEEAQAAKPRKPEPEKKTEKKKPAKKRKKFDMGKLGALVQGGWSAAKIADEMGVSEQTIYNKLKLLKEEQA